MYFLSFLNLFTYISVVQTWVFLSFLHKVLVLLVSQDQQVSFLVVVLFDFGLNSGP
jgi:hypothetical protein